MSIVTAFKPGKRDECYTPGYAVEPILEYIGKDKYILCPFDWPGSAFNRVLSNNGHSVDVSHIHEKPHTLQKDFFDYTREEVAVYDFIISNPPFSKKREVFRHLFYLGRPFAMLLGSPGGLFEGSFYNIVENKGVSVIYLTPRVQYERPYNIKKSSCPFQSVYICWKIPGMKALEFREVKR